MLTPHGWTFNLAVGHRTCDWKVMGSNPGSEATLGIGSAQSLKRIEVEPVSNEDKGDLVVNVFCICSEESCTCSVHNIISVSVVSVTCC